jgi:hypothetical protein
MKGSRHRVAAFEQPRKLLGGGAEDQKPARAEEARVLRMSAAVAAWFARTRWNTKNMKDTKGTKRMGKGLEALR